MLPPRRPSPLCPFVPSPLSTFSTAVSTKGIGKGTGLGLSMIRGLAAQLGGGLTIANAPGCGTTMSPWLPISAAAVRLDEGCAEPLAPPCRVGTALLVDDEELVRLSTADLLTDMQYEVIEAGSAEEALCLRDGGLAPDILITDHLMPGMSGTELTRQLRRSRPGLPVLIVSGYAEEVSVDADIPRLTKVFRNAELAASLAAINPMPSER